MGLHNEIREQPAILQNLLDTQWEPIREIARELQQRAVDYVFLAARGTSDHAGLYAKYLWGMHNRLPIALAAPSMFGLYGRPPQLNHSFVVGISQSGQSPDIVGVVAEGRKQGAPTLAITNDPDSPLAQTAEFVININAGTETAVAATKTYTAQLMSIAMLSVALQADWEKSQQTLWRVPELARQVLTLDEQAAVIAERYRYMDRCVVVGRGYNYATAYEWSLKLKELTYVVAEPYSSADFQHGPIAMVGPGFPVLAVATNGRVAADLQGLLTRLKEEHQAELLVISNDETLRRLGRTTLALPTDMPEWISPILSIIAAQLFTYHLTRAKGFDTEAPRSLHKVTRTL